MRAAAFRRPRIDRPMIPSARDVVGMIMGALCLHGVAVGHRREAAAGERIGGVGAARPCVASRRMAS